MPEGAAESTPPVLDADGDGAIRVSRPEPISYPNAKFFFVDGQRIAPDALEPGLLRFAATARRPRAKVVIWVQPPSAFEGIVTRPGRHPEDEALVALVRRHVREVAVLEQPPVNPYR